MGFRQKLFSEGSRHFGLRCKLDFSQTSCWWSSHDYLRILSVWVRWQISVSGAVLSADCDEALFIGSSKDTPFGFSGFGPRSLLYAEAKW